MPLLPASINFPSIDPVLLRIGPLAIRWYGVAYLLGFLFSYFLLRRAIRAGRLRITMEQLTDLLGLLVIGVVAGGRAGWWLFYHRATGSIEPWYEPLAIWHGGMSFHGGLIGVVLALAIWCIRSGAKIWNVADALALVAPVGLFLGRLANFINAELVGRPTDVAWGVIFPGESFARHPSQLYEAILEGPILLAFLWLCRHLIAQDGRIALNFLIGYGLARFAVEFTREPDVQLGFIAFGWLTMGQILSGIFVAVGLVGMLGISRCRRSVHANSNFLGSSTATRRMSAH